MRWRLWICPSFRIKWKRKQQKTNEEKLAGLSVITFYFIGMVLPINIVVLGPGSGIWGRLDAYINQIGQFLWKYHQFIDWNFKISLSHSNFNEWNDASQTKKFNSEFILFVDFISTCINYVKCIWCFSLVF